MLRGRLGGEWEGLMGWDGMAWVGRIWDRYHWRLRMEWNIRIMVATSVSGLWVKSRMAHDMEAYRNGQ